MKYHNITKDDMLNGDGLRVVLWVSGCEHHCHNCQNPITWNPAIGLDFDEAALNEICEQLEKDHVAGLTFSGGDPLHPNNRFDVFIIASYLKSKYPNKTIWLYTGYTWEDICDLTGLVNIDVIVDGQFVEELKDINYHWAGSTNQRVIDVQASLKAGYAIRHKSEGMNMNISEVYHKDNCGYDV